LPGIGGPFDTAAAFFEAWADTVKFKRDNETIRRMMERGPIPAEQMIAIIDQFPSQIKAMASRLSPTSNNGPFPLCHDDFLHSNIMVDADCQEQHSRQLSATALSRKMAQHSLRDEILAIRCGFCTESILHYWSLCL
jgi:hypothetical protein